MNQKIKSEWLEALRSGKYKQTTGCLKNEKGYCCLGVLSDLYAKQFNINWVPVENYKREEILDHGALLADPIQEWAELHNRNPRIYDYEHSKTLSDLNDEGNSFKEIADFIERYL